MVSLQVLVYIFVVLFQSVSLLSYLIPFLWQLLPNPDLLGTIKSFFPTKIIGQNPTESDEFFSENSVSNYMFTLLWHVNWEALKDHLLTNTRNTAEDNSSCLFMPPKKKPNKPTQTKRPDQTKPTKLSKKRIIIPNLPLMSISLPATHILIHLKGLLWTHLHAEVLQTHCDLWTWNCPSWL